MAARRFLLFIAMVATEFPTDAMFMEPDLERVPLQTLLENLEAKLHSSPQDVNLMRHLARAHAMAFVYGYSDTSKVSREHGNDAMWFSPWSRHVPYVGAYNLENALRDEDRAKKHLLTAISFYDKAVAADKSDIITRLGLAWCTEQLGKREQAIVMYRSIVEDAWEMEGNREFGGLGDFITVEAVSYLKPLLDPVKDDAEIKILDVRVQKLEMLPRAVTPVAIPLEDNLTPESMISNKSVAFDLDGTGRKLRWQWLKPNSAWLVFDHKGSGRITSAIQMFGSRTFTMFVANGYESMALLDDDQDGILKGNELDGLAMWHDRNENGISEPGEVRSLGEHGVRLLSCDSSTHSSGIQYSSKGIEFFDGIIRDTYDLILAKVDNN